MNYAFPPSPPVSLAISDTSERYPVRRIYCVGRNYSAHVREMGFDPERELPFFFCKPADSIVEAHREAQATVAYPSRTQDYQYEIELVVAIGVAGSNIAREDAGKHIFGYAVGIDMTRRDLQVSARKGGRPWEVGKSFDHSAPTGMIHRNFSVDTVPSPAIWIDVNGTRQQSSTLDKLIWSVPEIVAELSTLFHLEPGDLIFTGTPEGVGPVVNGDLMTGGIDGLSDIEIRVV